MESPEAASQRREAVEVVLRQRGRGRDQTPWRSAGLAVPHQLAPRRHPLPRPYLVADFAGPAREAAPLGEIPWGGPPIRRGPGVGACQTTPGLHRTGKQARWQGPVRLFSAAERWARQLASVPGASHLRLTL